MSELKIYQIPEGTTRIYHPDKGMLEADLVVIPESLTNIIDGIFGTCHCDFESHSPAFVYKDGVLYSSDMTTFYYCKPDTKEFIVPNTVTTLGRLSGCVNLEKISIPDSVTEIHDHAFCYCGQHDQPCISLKEVVVPDSVTEIGKCAFMRCTSLKKVVLPSKLTKIDVNMFYGCTALEDVNVPNGVEEIYDGAFKDCTSLKKIVLPASVTKIEDTAFSGCCCDIDCKDSKSFVFEDGVLYTSDKSTVLYCKTNVKEMNIPDTVTRIASEAFCNCTSLKKVTIPASVNEIEKAAFLNCSSLEAIDIPDSVNVIKDDTFRGCSSLKDVHIPDSVNKICSSAFQECTSLETIYVPDIENLGTCVFKGCTSLVKAEIPRGVGNYRHPESDPFLDCPNVKVRRRTPKK